MAKDADRRTNAGHFEASTSHKIVDLLSSVDDPQFEEAGLFLQEPRSSTNLKDEDRFGGWDVVNAPVLCISETEISSPKKKHGDLSSASLGGDSSVNHVANNIYNAKLYSQTVKAGIEYSNVPVWKTCVEPTTYRYIPNNGRYRSSKAIVLKHGVQKPVKRLAETKLNPEQRKLQKEIQRELRREFELAEQQVLRSRHGTKPILGETGSRSPSPPDHERAYKEKTKEIRMKIEIIRKQSSEPPNSPISLPPIAIPLVANISHSTQSSNRYDPLNDIANRDNSESQSRRSRHIDTRSKASRSRSEPPHPVSRAVRINHESAAAEFELGPTKLYRESSSTGLHETPRMSRGHRRKPERLERLISSKDSSAWTSNPNLLTEGSHLDMYYGHQKRREEYVSNSRERSWVYEEETRSRKSSQVTRKSDQSPTLSTAPLPVTQIKYMAASGEISKIPKFGMTTSDLDSPEDYYISIVKETQSQDQEEESNISVKSTPERLQNVMTTKFMNPVAVRQGMQDIPTHKFKAQALKGTGTHLFTDSNSTKLVTGGFRGVPVTQVKVGDRKQPLNPTRPMELSILPQIAGRKVNMAATSHRIV